MCATLRVCLRCKRVCDAKLNRLDSKEENIASFCICSMCQFAQLMKDAMTLRYGILRKSLELARAKKLKVTKECTLLSEDANYVYQHSLVDVLYWEGKLALGEKKQLTTTQREELEQRYESQYTSVCFQQFGNGHRAVQYIH